MVPLNGAAIARKTRRQTAVGLNSTEAEVKAMISGISLARAPTGLWGEFMHVTHGCIRVLGACRLAISQVLCGMALQTCASYK